MIFFKLIERQNNKNYHGYRPCLGIFAYNYTFCIHWIHHHAFYLLVPCFYRIQTTLFSCVIYISRYRQHSWKISERWEYFHFPCPKRLRRCWRNDLFSIHSINPVTLKQEFILKNPTGCGRATLRLVVALNLIRLYTRYTLTCRL